MCESACASAMLSFWYGVAKGATVRAEEAGAEVERLEAEVVRLQGRPAQIAAALMDAANIDREHQPFDRRS
jgi:hypothetical protein